MTLIYLLFFFLGLTVGSFLNVLADRLAHDESPFVGRSHCDHCKHVLSPADLVPVLSFLLMGGRCRYCRKKISWQYPIVELFTGVMFVSVFVYVMMQGTSNFELLTASLLTIFSAFLVILLADLKYQIIPDEMVLTVLIGALLYIWATHSPLLTHALTALAVTAGFTAIYILTRRRGLGLGDVKLVFALGLFLGPVYALVGLYLSFLTGAGVSLILILSREKRLKDKIAFGPFLILGATGSFFWGARIAVWYTHLVGIG